MCETDPTGNPADASAISGDVGTLSDPVDADLLSDLVTANHILYRYHVVDAFGHVSVRHDKDPGKFLLAKNMAPGTVTAEDIIEFNLNGEPVNAAGRRVYLERFIHGEIYKCREDVTAIVHSHAPAVVPFSVTSAPLRPLWHMSAFLGTEVPVYEIRDFAGDDTDLLIRSNELGESLARTLGQTNVVLMRGHGATIVGTTLREVVFRSVFTHMNAELQMNAMQLGEVNYLTPGECRTATDSVGGQADRAWNLWKAEL
jgi:HCOMODA/2-hydroxy-3-carboxy-muconic semialdehyde decarboxylase